MCISVSIQQIQKHVFSKTLFFSAWTEYHIKVIAYPFQSIFKYFSLFLHKKIMERFNIPLFFSPQKSTRQVFIKVLYNVQTFTSTVPTECRRYHKDCVFLFFSFFSNEAMQGHSMMQRCQTKLFKWKHKAVLQCRGHTIKEDIIWFWTRVNFFQHSGLDLLIQPTKLLHKSLPLIGSKYIL